MTDCIRVDGGFNCTNTCESGWFKIWNETAQPNYGKYCDKAFFGKYQNVLWELLVVSTVENTVAKSIRIRLRG